MGDDFFTVGGDALVVLKSFIFLGICIALAALVMLIRLLATKENKKFFLALTEIQLLFDAQLIGCRVAIYVNGAEFIFAIDEPLQKLPVKSKKNEKVIELPAAEMYYIRFEINLSSEQKLEGGPALIRGKVVNNHIKKVASQVPVTFPTLPLVADYKLYFLQDGSRDTSVKAIISYAVYAK